MTRVKVGRSIGRVGVIAAMLATVLAPTAAASARGGPSKTRASAGYDISYPQCSSAYPSHPLFGIVGVNGGLANDANPCFQSELDWALASTGTSNQPPASLYINTADPGPGVADWPTSGDTAAYGACDGGWTEACAYLYGQARAQYSYGLVWQTDQTVATGAPWWLDIETANSWATSATPGYAQLNIAAVQGFMDGLTGAGATAAVGIYSTASQWKAITGLTAQTTASGLGSSPPDWVAGARSPSGAQGNCTSGGFTGASPTLAQYFSGGFDADLRC